MTRLLFWAATAVVGYTYVGFPLLVHAPGPTAAAAHTGPPTSRRPSASSSPRTTRRRRSGLASTTCSPSTTRPRPPSSSSPPTARSDATVAEATRRPIARVRVLDLPRLGKAAALNAAVAASTGEILVFSDANTAYAPDAIRQLVRSFADPEVGGVAGNQVYLPASAEDGPFDPAAATAVGAGERSYWDFDRLVKEAESLGGSVISATGAIYAMRRELFRPVPDGVTDDFVTSTRVVAQGRRLVFEPAAVALEPVAGSSGREYRRKVRIMTRGLRGVAVARGLLDPRVHGFYSVQLCDPQAPAPADGRAAPRHRGRQPGPAGTPDRCTGSRPLGQVAMYGLGAAGLALGDRPAGRRPWFAIPAFFVPRERGLAARARTTSSPASASTAGCPPGARTSRPRPRRPRLTATAERDPAA